MGRILGRPGSKVTLRILRDGRPMQFELVRRTFGLHPVHARLEHGVGKDRSQERQREVLMLIVNTVGRGRIPLQVQQVTQIVQQRSGDERIRCARRFRQGGGLQRVLQLGDGLTAVGNVAVAVKERADVVEAERHDAAGERNPAA